MNERIADRRLIDRGPRFGLERQASANIPAIPFRSLRDLFSARAFVDVRVRPYLRITNSGQHHLLSTYRS